MPKDKEVAVEAKLDTVIRLLEDLFILEASKANIGRESIRSVLGVGTTRISKVASGLKKAKQLN